MEFKKGIHFNIDLENAILGACMIEKEAFGRTFGLVEKQHFYNDTNKLIYQSLAEMYNEGMQIDIITTYDFILQNNRKRSNEETNIAHYLAKVTMDIVSSANLEYHSFILKRMWMERELMSLTNGGIKLEGEVPEQVFQLTKSIEKINSGQFQKEWYDMREVMMQLSAHQDMMTTTQGKGLPTGVEKLDDANGGLFAGMLVVIGARPSVGKSAFMGQMALSMAKLGKKVGIVSLEMNNNEIAARLSSIESHTDFKTIFRNLFNDEEARHKWHSNLNNFVNLPIYITDKTNVSATNIKAKAQKLKHDIKGIDCLFIDYLQLVSSEADNKSRNRENEVSQISRTCKLIAKDLNIPVIILCQLNRDVTKRTGKNRYPQLSDLRESGAIEQDADVVMFLHRDWTTGIEEYMYDENGNSKENHADLIVRKWRNGESNLHIELEFDAPKMRFVEKKSYSFSPTEDLENDLKQNPF